MASLSMVFGAAASSRVFAATAATKSTGGAKEKGPLDWILGGLQKEDQFYETDPILNKADDKNGGGTGSKKSTTSVSVPSKKKSNGVFGGLFAKK